jgi:RNA polymerase sigma factor (sigma-70 family)
MNKQAHHDQYIIEGIASNNSTVLNEVYKKHSGKMVNWAKQHGASADEAQDLFQDVLIDIYRTVTAKQFVLTCPFEAFLMAVVRNKWYTQVKKNSKIQVTNNEEILYNNVGTIEQSAQEIIDYENKYKLLVSKLDELAEGCKELLKLSWAGKCMEDVALALNVTYAYVRKKKSLCIAKLVEDIKNSNEYLSIIMH